MPVLAWRKQAAACFWMTFNSATVNCMERWSGSSSFSRSARLGTISATTFRWAWVSFTE